MTADGFFRLAWQSVTAPRDVARLLLSTGLGREALLTGFALVVVLNGLVLGASAALMPGQIAATGFASPMAFMALQAASLGLSIVMLTWAGRGLGGQGGFAEIAVVMIWLQALRVTAQALILVLLLLVPILGQLAVFVASALGVWIAVNFLDEAHELGSPLKALGVLVLGVVGMAIALSVVLAALGIAPQGMTGYV